MPLENIRTHLAEGHVIPAMPLALHQNGEWSQTHQRALVRYYVDAGVGGLAVGVHSTQFEIREPGHDLYEPVLSLCSEELDSWLTDDASSVIKIAGICGNTEQALAEASVALKHGYDAGLLSMTAVSNQTDEQIIEHCERVSEKIPIIGFYLQPTIGGRNYSYSFWRRFADIENVVAIKIAPFDRYATFDVVRAVIDAGREDIVLYTGNDDNIIGDLLTAFEWKGTTRRIVGGLLGQWGVWTKKAVELLDEIKVSTEKDLPNLLTQNAQLTDANGIVFDAANRFSGCIPGILEVLRRQGLVPSNRCLNPDEKLSPGQSEELDRIIEAYPHFTDDDFVAENLEKWLSV